MWPVSQTVWNPLDYTQKGYCPILEGLPPPRRVAAAAAAGEKSNKAVMPHKWLGLPLFKRKKKPPALYIVDDKHR